METLQWVVAVIVLIGATGVGLGWWGVGGQGGGGGPQKVPQKGPPPAGEEKIVIKSSKPDRGSGQ